MSKLVGGIAIIGAAVASGCIVHVYHKKTIKSLEDKLKVNEACAAEIDEYKESLDKAKSKIEDLGKANQALANSYENICTIHNNTVMSFNNILDVNMIADIIGLSYTDDRDACLREVENAINNISRSSVIHKSDIINNEHRNSITSKMTKCVNDMTINIKEVINNSEIDDDDDDDDIDENIITVSPKRIILTCIDGTVKTFNAEPDGGFEVIDGSDPENNDYCIIAQNVPPLYNMLFDSIKNQLKSHYVFEVDPDVFDSVLEDMVITISFSFIDDEDVVVTAVNAVVPFELFGEHLGDNKQKIYCTKEGEVNLDAVKKYFNINNDDKLQKDKDVSKNKQTKDLKNVPLSDDTVHFIVENIGFNRESLKSFIGKLAVLIKANPEAGDSIYSVFCDIIQGIHDLKDRDLLTDEERSKISISLRALNTNMRKNYGSDIKSYTSR